MDLKHPQSIKENTKKFLFCCQNLKTKKLIMESSLNICYQNCQKIMNHKKLICECNNKLENLVHYRPLKFLVRHGKQVTDFKLSLIGWKHTIHLLQGREHQQNSNKKFKNF